MVHGLDTLKRMNEEQVEPEKVEVTPVSGWGVVVKKPMRLVVDQINDQHVQVRAEYPPVELKEGAWYRDVDGGVCGPAVKKGRCWYVGGWFCSSSETALGVLVEELPWEFYTPTVVDLALAGTPLQGWVFADGLVQVSMPLRAIDVQCDQAFRFFVGDEGSTRWCSDFRMSRLK